MASARDVVPGPAVLSTIRTLAPSLVSQRARTRPVGPAPTTRTSHVFMSGSSRSKPGATKSKSGATKSKPNATKTKSGATKSKRKSARRPTTYLDFSIGYTTRGGGRLLADGRGRAPATAGTLARPSDYHKKLSLRLSAADDMFGLPRRGLLNEQGDPDKSKDDQRATRDEDITETVPRMTCAHRLLVRFRHDGSFARIAHGLLILAHDWTKPSRSPPRTMRAGPRSEKTPEARYRSGQSQREPGDEPPPRNKISMVS